MRMVHSTFLLVSKNFKLIFDFLKLNLVPDCKYAVYTMLPAQSRFTAAEIVCQIPDKPANQSAQLQQLCLTEGKAVPHPFDLAGEDAAEASNHRRGKSRETTSLTISSPRAHIPLSQQPDSPGGWVMTIKLDVTSHLWSSKTILLRHRRNLE